MREDVWMEVEPELRPARIHNPATRYGVWWHDFAERIPWTGDAVDRQGVFDRSMENSPDMARSKKEWELLQQLVPSADLGSRLNAAVFLQSEMPFF
jgi:hypothetical protein